jgi:predicted DNA-binding transcriptional regulator YafY
MFSENELEALVFGARMVQNWSDAELGRAADAALSKIENVLPAHLHRMLDDRSLWAPKDVRRVPVSFDLGQLRASIRECRKVRFRYQDEKGAETRRKVRPLSLWFYPPFWTAASWCELRDDFRFFRVDRMSDVEFLGEAFVQEAGKSAEDLFRHLLSKS